MKYSACCYDTAVLVMTRFASTATADAEWLLDNGFVQYRQTSLWLKHWTDVSGSRETQTAHSGTKCWRIRDQWESLVARGFRPADVLEFAGQA